MTMMAAENRSAVVKRNPETAVRLSSVADFFAIETERLRIGVSVKRLCEAAGVPERTYYEAREKGRPRPSTVKRLAGALGSVTLPGQAEKPRSVPALLNMATSMLAIAMGLDPVRDVLAHDFGKQKPLDRAWLLASQTRRGAAWLLLMHVAGVDRKDIAAAYPCSRQNVAQLIAFVEERMEAEPAFAAVLERVAGWINGGR